MSVIDITISCPHCRRQYTMKADLERLQRVKTRATCGRCRNSFDVASRIVAPFGAPPPTEAPVNALPKLRPPAPPKPRRQSSTTNPPPSELTELAREFADAAARFTPVGPRPAGLSTMPGKPPSSTAVPAQPAAEQQIPTRPGVRPMALPDESAWVLPRIDPPAEPKPPAEPEPAAAKIARMTLAPAALPVEKPLQPPPSEPSLVAASAAVAPVEAAPEPAPPAAAAPAAEAPPPFDAAPAEAPSVEAQPPAPLSWPLSWIDRADPGIAHLLPPPSPAASALEQLL
jgi:hypothetical protein